MLRWLDMTGDVMTDLEIWQAVIPYIILGVVVCISAGICAWIDYANFKRWKEDNQGLDDYE